MLPERVSAGAVDSAEARRPGGVQTTGSRHSPIPQLEALVAEAMQYNGDLRVAAARDRAGGGLRARRRRRSSTRPVDCSRAAAARLSATTRDSRAGCSAPPGNSTCGAACVTAFAAGRSNTPRRQADFEFARQSLAALVAKSWFLATEAPLQQRMLTEMVDAAEQASQLAEHR